MHKEREGKGFRMLNQLKVSVMKRMFTVQTTRTKVERVNNKHVVTNTPLLIQVEMHIEGKEILLGYGYATWTTKSCSDQYTIHHCLIPKKGDVWKYGRRVFTVGQCSGFVCYTAPLLENGHQVATIKFEDYYKD